MTCERSVINVLIVALSQAQINTDFFAQNISILIIIDIGKYNKFKKKVLDENTNRHHW